MRGSHMYNSFLYQQVSRLTDQQQEQWNINFDHLLPQLITIGGRRLNNTSILIYSALYKHCQHHLITITDKHAAEAFTKINISFQFHLKPTKASN